MLNASLTCTWHRQHVLTRHWVCSGPGFQVAQELGDAANGGQVRVPSMCCQHCHTDTNGRVDAL